MLFAVATSTVDTLIKTALNVTNSTVQLLCLIACEISHICPLDALFAQCTLTYACTAQVRRNVGSRELRLVDTGSKLRESREDGANCQHQHGSGELLAGVFYLYT